jgi:hypothetical protein
MTDTMRWRIFDPRGNLIGATRYACDAAKLAICNGPGATVRHGDKLVLTVAEDTALEGALPTADEMIAAAYDRSPRSA